MKSLTIIFRSCARVRAMGSSDRPFGMSKEEIIFKCLKSVLESAKRVKSKIVFEIVDDSSPEDFREKMQKLLEQYKFKFKINRIEVRNNGLSLLECYKIAEKVKTDLIYFLEDDYFHLENSIPAIIDAYESNIVWDDKFAIYPCDYPQLYVNLTPSYIFLGRFNHWRSTAQTTGTFVMQKEDFLKNKDVFHEFGKFNIKGHGGERETINKLWEEKIPCISAVESLAAHLHTTSLPHLVNWKREIEKI